MSSKYEQAAGLVESYTVQHGDLSVVSMGEDIVNILRICHEQVGGNDSVLGEAIAMYVAQTYAPAADFSKTDTARA